MVTPLTSISKTTESSRLWASKILKTENNEFIRGGRLTNEIVMNLSKSKKLENNKSEISTGFKVMEESIFLTIDAKEVFNYLRQMFIEALIFQYFDSEYYI